jgi:GH15 family glucan-1,4-alpha-glucosidase
VWALWEHFSRFRDIEFVKPFYRSLIIRPAEFMLRFRDQESGLPLPSHDLWEERLGVHTFTVATVCAGLSAAANFAEAFGEMDHASRYRETVATMRQALLARLYYRDEHRLARAGMVRSGQEGLDLDTTCDSSVYAALLLGACTCDDPQMISTAEALKERLWIRTDVGGMARYEGDNYQRVEDDIGRVPGNPWFISTLWYAQYRMMRANSVRELRETALPILEWVADHALPSGVLAEQVHPHTNEPLSVAPLTWSHGTMVVAVLDYLDRLEELRARPEYG